MRINVGGQRINLASRAVGETQRQAASAIRPGEAAAAETAKYGALGAIANNAVEAFETVNEARFEADVTTATKEARTQIRDKLVELSKEDHSPEEWARQWQDFEHSLKVDLTGATRSKQASNAIADWLDEEYETGRRRAAEMAIHSNRVNLRREETEALEGLMSMQAWDDVLNSAAASRTLSDKQREYYKTEAQARRLFQDYEQAENGSEFLAELGRDDLDPSVESRLIRLVSQHNRMLDAEFQKVEVEQKAARARDIAMFKQDMTASTTDMEILKFAEEHKITDPGTINGFFTKREQQITSKQVLSQDFIDPTSAKTREALTERINMTTSDPQQRVSLSIQLAAETGAAPMGLERYFEGAGRSPGAFVDAAENYRAFRELAPTAYMTLSDDAKSLFSQHAVLTRSGMDPVAAANTAWEIVHNSTPEVIQARRNNYDPGAITDVVLKDRNDIPGLHIPGFLRDKVTDVPIEMQADANRIGLAVFSATGDEAAAQQAIRDNLPNIWGITDVNRNVNKGDDKVGHQYMKNPPRRDAKFVRAVLSQQLSGKEFLINNELRNVGSREVELYQPPLPEENQYGQPVWTLRVDGVPLLDDMGQVVRWTYEPPPSREVSQVPSKEAMEAVTVEPADVSGTTEGELPELPDPGENYPIPTKGPAVRF